MDAHLIFWLYAYGLMLVVLIIAGLGIQKAKAGDYQKHLRAMIAACNILLFFVFSYVVKVFVLGREDKSAWSALQLTILYTHEFLILVMLVSGVYARILAAKFKHSLFTDKPSAEDLVHRAAHRRWGKLAFRAACAAFLTATGVIAVLFSLRQ